MNRPLRHCFFFSTFELWLLRLRFFVSFQPKLNYLLVRAFFLSKTNFYRVPVCATPLRPLAMNSTVISLLNNSTLVTTDQPGFSGSTKGTCSYPTNFAEVDYISTYIYLLAIPTICVLGAGAAVMCIVVFTRKQMRFVLLKSTCESISRKDWIRITYPLHFLS